MGYYDLDDILTDSTDVPCKFKHDIPGLGYLENNPGKSIKENSKLMLPLWLARILAIVGADPSPEEAGITDEEPVPFVELLTPETFSIKVINAIKTDPRSLDLHSVNPHFYGLAIKWCSLFSDKELATVINDLLLARSQEINNYAYSTSIQNNNIDAIGSTNQGQTKRPNIIGSSPFLLTLDEQEKVVYRSAHESYKDSKKWLLQK